MERPCQPFLGGWNGDVSTTLSPLRMLVSNAYLLVGNRRPVLVDTGARVDARRLRAGLAAAGVEPRDLGLILHTHVHSDHFGNTAEMAAIAGCPVAYHPADGFLARQGHNGSLRGVHVGGRLLARVLGNIPFRPREADIAATDGLRLTDFGLEATVLHTPGHTAGSISVLLDDGDAIIGDLLMGGVAGGTFWRGRPSLHYFAEDLPMAMKSLDRILGLASGLLHVGHGGPLTHGAVVRWRADHQRAMGSDL